MDTVLSIIVPVYKVEKYLCKCVESILSQTYSNLEIILVDDGSLDGCPSICDAFALRDSRVKVIHKENGGLSSARNAGLDVATGEYIGFVDGDDYIDPKMYEKLYSVLVEDEADMAVCNFQFVDSKENPLRRPTPVPTGTYSGREALAFLQNKNYGPFVSACNKLFSKSLFTISRFPVGKLNEDNLTAYKRICECNKVSMISDSLYFYRQRPDSIMHRGISLAHFADMDAMVEKTAFYKANGFEEYISASERQTIDVYRWLRIQLDNVASDEEQKLAEYDSLAESLYKKHKKGCSWKTHLFFKCRFMYKLLFAIKRGILK